jgi:hypothetical protein
LGFFSSLSLLLDAVVVSRVVITVGGEGRPAGVIATFDEVGTIVAVAADGGSAVCIDDAPLFSVVVAVVAIVVADDEAAKGRRPPATKKSSYSSSHHQERLPDERISMRILVAMNNQHQ